MESRHQREVRRRRLRLPRLLLELERRLRQRHRPHHRPRRRRLGPRLRSRRGRGRVALLDRRRQLEGDRRLAPVAVVGRPRAERRRTASLWYATGEANTGGTSYVGSGVYRLASPTTGQFSPSDRVGGNELESTTINSIRFAGGRVWAATLRGVWYHSSTTTSGPWTLAYAPNPGYLPASLQQYSATQTGFGSISTSSTTNAPYKNIVNDIAIDPKDATHVLAAIGWRSGDSYNGFYETHDNGVTWTKINPTGGLDGTDVGYVELRLLGRWDEAVRDQPVAAEDQHARLLEHGPRRDLRLVDRLACGPVEPHRVVRQARRDVDRLGALRQLRPGLQPGRAGLVQPVHRRRPEGLEPRLRGARGGLRDEGRRLELVDRGAVLELLLLLLGPRRRVQLGHGRGHALPADDALGSALGRDRQRRRQAVRLRRQRRRRLPAAAERQRQRERQRDRLAEPQRRHRSTRCSTTRSGSASSPPRTRSVPT